MPASTIQESVADLPLIDCDSHLTEPPDLWTSRAPMSMRDRVPVQRTANGRTEWTLDGELWANTGGNVIRRNGEKVLGTLYIHPFEEIHPAAYDIPERLKMMDQLGISAQILYPNAIGFSSNHLFAIEDLKERYEILRIYNDFLVDAQHQSNGRLYPQGVLPMWDIDLTVKEMQRLLDQGMRGFTISDKPEMLGLPELPEKFFAPMWDLFNEARAVVNFHIGSGATRAERQAARDSLKDYDEEADADEYAKPRDASQFWRVFGGQRKLAVRSALMFLSNLRIIANLTMSDLFDRYPNLKVVSAESGIGWVPFLMEALEYQLDENLTNERELSYQQRRPTEYFRDHIFVTLWFESISPRKLLDEIGVNNVLVETDLPHATCLYPDAREHFETIFADVPVEARRRVFFENACDLYRLELPA